jgi:hypothetical protein
MALDIVKGIVAQHVTNSTRELTRLYRDARQNELRLQSDLDAAREVQQLLLPRRAPDIRGLDLPLTLLRSNSEAISTTFYLRAGEGSRSL